MRKKFFIFQIILVLLISTQAVFGNVIYSRRLAGPSKNWSAPKVDEDTIRKSLRSQRQAAWHIALELFSEPQESSQRTARWLQWYRAEEFTRVFSNLWSRLSADEKLQRAHFPVASLDTVFQSDWEELVNSPNWNDVLYRQWMDSLDDPEAKLGAFGLYRDYFSPSLFRSLFQNYDSVVRCSQEFLEGKQSQPCLKTSFDRNAVAVKAIWRLESLGVPVFETDSRALQTIFESENKEWLSMANVDSASGALRVRRGDRLYSLVGLHITSKVFRNWFWISLWWSPESQRDFGADRPADWPPELAYKMCSVSGFGDPGVNDLEDVELHKIYALMEKQFPGEQWCSNPYIEHGKNNAMTNCIGCHENAGRSRDLQQEEILARPDFGRRSNGQSPTDFLWSFEHDPARLGIRIHQMVNTTR